MGWARAAQLAEPERASHSGAAVVRLKTGTELNLLTGRKFSG